MPELLSLGRLSLFAMMPLLVLACSPERASAPSAVPKAAASEARPASLAGLRPNILLIVADDLGYSDISAFGGEIKTPNIDSLAAGGMKLTNFHVNTTCSPTRAMLFAGVDSHVAGYGTMPGLETEAQRDRPGYEAFLNDRVVTFPKLLQDAGYATYISGKWDQGGRNGRGKGPKARGFDRSFVLIEGLADHFRAEGVYNVLSPVHYVEDGEEVELPEDFYSTRSYTDKLIEYIDADRAPGQPFFAMLSFTAPHYPVQSLDDDMAQYEEIYAAGYEAVRRKRLARQRELGLVGEDWKIPEIRDWQPSWDELSPEMRALETKRMAAYAGMITAMDRNIGRLLERLEESGLRDNTLVIFMSDNGPDQSNPLDTAKFANSLEWMSERYSFAAADVGRRGSFTWTGPAWASVSATPWKFHKHFMTRGGVNVPFIVSLPGRIPAGAKSDAFVSVLDLLPTFLELAGAHHPGGEYEGRPVAQPDGKSMTNLLAGAAASVHSPDDVFGLEIFDRRMIQKGDWKIVWANPPWGKAGAWSLYNLAEDPAETTDLADSNPAKLAEMIEEWGAYVARNGVIPNEGYVLPIGATASHFEWLPPSPEPTE